MAGSGGEKHNLLMDSLYLFLEVVLSLWESFLRLFVSIRVKEIRGEVALVTGAGHGIGKELAIQLAELGVKVVCWDINEAWCKETAKCIKAQGGHSWAYQCDVTDRAQVEEMTETVRNEVGEVTLLFNNAGIMPAKPFLRFSAEEIHKIFDVNVFGQIYLLLEHLPRMLAMDHGHVVSVASVCGVTGVPYLVPYCASKHAVRGLMDGIFLEHYKEHPNTKVKLTTILPFTINTGLAHDPTTRFPSLIPIIEPEECARQIIEGMRRNQEEVFVPKQMGPIFKLGKLFPRRMQLAIGDYLDCTVGYKL